MVQLAARAVLLDRFLHAPLSGGQDQICTAHRFKKFSFGLLVASTFGRVMMKLCNGPQTDVWLSAHISWLVRSGSKPAGQSPLRPTSALCLSSDKILRSKGVLHTGLLPICGLRSIRHNGFIMPFLLGTLHYLETVSSSRASTSTFQCTQRGRTPMHRVAGCRKVAKVVTSCAL